MFKPWKTKRNTWPTHAAWYPGPPWGSHSTSPFSFSNANNKNWWSDLQKYAKIKEKVLRIYCRSNDLHIHNTRMSLLILVWRGFDALRASFQTNFTEWTSDSDLYFIFVKPESLWRSPLTQTSFLETWLLRSALISCDPRRSRLNRHWPNQNFEQKYLKFKGVTNWPNSTAIDAPLPPMEESKLMCDLKRGEKNNKILLENHGTKIRKHTKTTTSNLKERNSETSVKHPKQTKHPHRKSTESSTKHDGDYQH